MSKKPTYLAYTVQGRDKGQKSIWTRIGAAWPHKKGDGFTVELKAVPVDGRLVLMKPKDAGDTFEGATK